MTTATSAEEPLNLLFFGNSFTNSSNSDVHGRVGLLAVADGYPAPLVVGDITGGTDLDYHFGQLTNFPNNNVNHSSISGMTWDYMVMQGYSTEATHLRNPNFEADALTLFSGFRDHSSGRGAGVKAVLYQTWARQPGHSLYPGSFADATEMQAEIRSGYNIALVEIQADSFANAARIAPVGDGFETMNFNSSLYRSDKYHANNTGSLLASMILYRTIYGEDVSDIDYSTLGFDSRVDFNTWSALAATADAVSIVPEPASALLLGAGLILALPNRWRSNRGRV